MNMVGLRMKELRKQKRWTQVDLSKASGVSQQAVSFIESGRNSPSEATLRLIADALGVTVSYLLGQSENKKPAQEMSRQELVSDIVREFLSLPEDVQVRAIGYAQGLLANRDKE